MKIPKITYKIVPLNERKWWWYKDHYNGYPVLYQYRYNAKKYFNTFFNDHNMYGYMLSENGIMYYKVHEDRVYSFAKALISDLKEIDKNEYNLAFESMRSKLTRIYIPDNFHEPDFKPYYTIVYFNMLQKYLRKTDNLYYISRFFLPGRENETWDLICMDNYYGFFIKKTPLIISDDTSVFEHSYYIFPKDSFSFIKSESPQMVITNEDEGISITRNKFVKTLDECEKIVLNTE